MRCSPFSIHTARWADALHLLDGVAHEEHRDVAGLDERTDARLALVLEED